MKRIGALLLPLPKLDFSEKALCTICWFTWSTLRLMPCLLLILSLSKVKQYCPGSYSKSIPRWKKFLLKLN